jgi:hypothetical protein
MVSSVRLPDNLCVGTCCGNAGADKKTDTFDFARFQLSRLVGADDRIDLAQTLTDRPGEECREGSARELCFLRAHGEYHVVSRPTRISAVRFRGSVQPAARGRGCCLTSKS